MQKKKLFIIAWCILLPLFLLLLSYKLTLLLFPVTIAQAETFSYLSGQGRLNMNYTSLEMSHLDDVKKVMDTVNFLFYGLLIIVLIMIISQWKKKKFLVELCQDGGFSTIGTVILLFLAIILSFNITFTIFHLLFFPQGNWQFPADSLLIKNFPIGFFVRISTWIALLSFAEGSIFILLSYFLSYESHRN